MLGTRWPARSTSDAVSQRLPSKGNDDGTTVWRPLKPQDADAVERPVLALGDDGQAPTHRLADPERGRLPDRREPVRQRPVGEPTEDVLDSTDVGRQAMFSYTSVSGSGIGESPNPRLSTATKIHPLDACQPA